MISEGLLKNLAVQGLCDDSRCVKNGDLFFSMPTADFETFAKAALAAGAVAIVGETPAPEGMASKWIQVADVKAARLEAAKIFYRDPFGKLTVHAVTGTNGKTTARAYLKLKEMDGGEATTVDDILGDLDDW